MTPPSAGSREASACRGSFGPTAHWCTTLEVSRIPDVTALPEGMLWVRPTPPLMAETTERDWVVGKTWTACAPPGCTSTPAIAMTVVREGGDGTFNTCDPSGLGIACCAEPTP